MMMIMVKMMVKMMVMTMIVQVRRHDNGSVVHSSMGVVQPRIHTARFIESYIAVPLWIEVRHAPGFSRSDDGFEVHDLMTRTGGLMTG
jgi:hypothetical protein